jgi:hypothetical protein
MGSLEVGSLLLGTVGQIKVGTSNVQAIYAGSTLVFPQPTTTTTTTTTSTTTTTTTVAPTTTTTTTTSTTTTTTTIPITTSTTTTTTTLGVVNCGITVDPYANDTYITYDLGTTSGTVTLSSNITQDCLSASFIVYYPAVVNPSNIIYASADPGTFTYTYNGVNTTALVVYDTSAC